ncbi:putative sugar transporter protein [Neofusicoccum parvum UCRNP2]|uniref:Putative sugar transporter protein n=1 Tax=Botryosphaeria parva (strain UCR-NP2) TaxID=1287680 RepID=R1G6A8_BOTPV|nr:putative sugar transporter protein [Neofusicoccum parvum UCRNP2]
MAPYFGLKGGWLTFWVTVACATDMTLFGGVVVTQDFLDTLNLDGKTTLISTVTAIYDIGCFFGAILAFMVGESVIGGLGNGINTATAPVWQGETSKASWRGKLIVIEMILNIAGFSLSNWVTYGFSFVGGPVSWRFPIAFQFIFIFILFGTTPWLPESPRIDEAEQILADLESLSVDDPYVITQSKDIQWAVNYERENAVRWRDLLRGRTGDQGGTCTIRRLVLGMGTQAMQQLSGINVTSYYLPYVLINSVGLDNNLARLLAACNSVSYLLFSTIGIPNVERWGRRKMMMYAAAVVEITPPGIESLGWQFYIIWTVFNGAFVPIVYLFYPETADRSLEDLDRLFIENHNIFIFRDKDAISSKRPVQYIEHEKEEIRRHSSIKPEDVSGAIEAHRKEVLASQGHDEKIDIV